MRITYNVERITVKTGSLKPAVIRYTYSVLLKPEVSQC